MILARCFFIVWAFFLLLPFLEQLNVITCGFARVSIPMFSVIMILASLFKSLISTIWWLGFLVLGAATYFGFYTCADLEPVAPIYILGGFAWASWNARLGPCRSIAIIFLVFIASYWLAFLIWAQLDLLERTLLFVATAVGPPAVLIMEVISKGFDDYRRRGAQYAN